MKLIATATFLARTSKRRSLVRPGSRIDVPDEYGKELIRNGLAKEDETADALETQDVKGLETKPAKPPEGNEPAAETETSVTAAPETAASSTPESGPEETTGTAPPWGSSPQDQASSPRTRKRSAAGGKKKATKKTGK